MMPNNPSAPAEPTLREVAPPTLKTLIDTFANAHYVGGHDNGGDGETFAPIDHEAAEEALRAYISAIESEREALLSRVTALEQDAARLDWLQEHATRPGTGMRGRPGDPHLYSLWLTLHTHLQVESGPESLEHLNNDSAKQRLRAAIDAASRLSSSGEDDTNA